MTRPRSGGRRNDMGDGFPSSRGHRDPQEASQTNVTATVKWFNPSKGFGFVAPADGSPDAFLHISVLNRAGYGEVAEGATIVCDLGQGQRGMQVVSVHDVDSTTAAPRAMGGGPRRGFAAEPGPTVEGTVKFFSDDKGFGFVAVDEGGKDVFVHVRALERSGLRTLESGQRVRLTTVIGQKGPQAESVAII